MADLNHRARKILNAVVQEYLHRGDAVGSRTVTRRHGIDLSPATVRNVMADLEELGLLRQPHTSAGRVPTTQGLRFYIDSLLKVRGLSGKEKDEVRARFDLPDADVDDVLSNASKVLAELSGQAAIVVAPVPERQRLEHLEFVRLLSGDLLVVLVTEGGQIQNRLIRAPDPPEPAVLERINNYLNERVAGRTIDEVRRLVIAALADEKHALDELGARALRLGEEALRPGLAPGVTVAGQAHLLEGGEPGAGLEQARALLAALEEKNRIVQLLDRTLEADGIQVWLGAETPFAEVADLSVVATPYGPEDRPVGSIAVIGPTRMNYAKVISLVDFTAEVLSGIINPKRQP